MINHWTSKSILSENICTWDHIWFGKNKKNYTLLCIKNCTFIIFGYINLTSLDVILNKYIYIYLYIDFVQKIDVVIYNKYNRFLYHLLYTNDNLEFKLQLQLLQSIFFLLSAALLYNQ